MPPLPGNNTAVYFVDYKSNLNEHTVQFRYDDGGTGAEPPTSFIASVGAFLDTLVPFFPSDFAILGARKRADGGTVSLPATAPGITSTPTGTPTLQTSPSFLSFIGRSALGRRVRVTLLGTKAGAVQSAGEWGDYRVSVSENATLAAARTTLDGMPLLAIDGAEITWYPYVNAGYSAYWQRQARG